MNEIKEMLDNYTFTRIPARDLLGTTLEECTGGGSCKYKYSIHFIEGVALTISFVSYAQFKDKISQMIFKHEEIEE